MIRVTLDGPEPSSNEWLAYKAGPSAETFGLLAQRTPSAERGVVLSAMQKLFFETQNWKIAQHLVVLFSGPDGHGLEWPSDQLLASYFAAQARGLSEEHPMALLAQARIHWLRRLVPAVSYNLEHLGGAQNDAGERERRTLAALCLGYQGRTAEAWQAIKDGIPLGGVGEQAGHQLLCALQVGDPVLREVAEDLLPLAHQLTPRHAALLLRHFRHDLVNVFRRRCEV